TSERILADLDGRAPDDISESSRQALDAVPHAAMWAERFTRGMRISAKGFRRHAAPSAVRCAVQGIARACIPDPDTTMYELLGATVDDCTQQLRGRPITVDPARWVEACELTR
ncbi:MAG TPA: hypothetical protein VK895_10180, partial [Jiangellaceae bacterium]|nr:hypothetical protein [Jiangellaceae bacterium]